MTFGRILNKGPNPNLFSASLRPCGQPTMSSCLTGPRSVQEKLGQQVLYAKTSSLPLSCPCLLPSGCFGHDCTSMGSFLKIPAAQHGAVVFEGWLKRLQRLARGSSFSKSLCLLGSASEATEFLPELRTKIPQNPFHSGCVRQGLAPSQQPVLLPATLFSGH